MCIYQLQKYIIRVNWIRLQFTVQTLQWADCVLCKQQTSRLLKVGLGETANLRRRDDEDGIVQRVVIGPVVELTITVGVVLHRGEEGVWLRRD